MSARSPFPPGDERDLDAGEYALGLGSADERAAAAARVASDPAFAAAVDAWHARLAPLADEIAPVEAPERVWTGVLRALGVEDGVVVDLSRRLRRWKHAAVGATAVAASLLAILIMRPQTAVEVPVPAAPAPVLMTASLVSPTGAAVAVVSHDAGSGRLVVTPVAVETGADRSAELWLIAPGAAPRSLGLVSSVAATPVALPDDFNAAGTLAITIEPRGGSPTGQPTSAPIGAGTLARI
jgi:anti-sigma-K factor RskA